MRALAMWAALVGLAGLWPLTARAQAEAHAISVRDDKGALVHLTRSPQRIVSLMPSLTEATCALGACAKLVGTDRWSNWPASVRALPKLGGLDDPNVELIVAQRPDLVLVAPATRVAARLRALGLTVAELDAADLPATQRLLGKVAALLGTPQRAAAVWQRLVQEIDAASRLVPEHARGTRVYVEVGATPYAAGETSFIGQLLTRLGARNVVPAAMGPFPKLNPEFVVRSAPDLIVIAADEAPGLARRPGWAQMAAVRGQRVCTLGRGDYDLLARPGPRLGQGAAVLARCLAAHGRSDDGGRKGASTPVAQEGPP